MTSQAFSLRTLPGRQVVQNRERTGVPARATRVGWWMRPDHRLNLSGSIPSLPLGVLYLSPAKAGPHIFWRLIHGLTPVATIEPLIRRLIEFFNRAYRLSKESGANM